MQARFTVGLEQFLTVIRRLPAPGFHVAGPKFTGWFPSPLRLWRAPLLVSVGAYDSGAGTTDAVLRDCRQVPAPPGSDSSDHDSWRRPVAADESRVGVTVVGDRVLTESTLKEINYEQDTIR